MTDAPWNRYASYVKTVQLTNALTSVCDYAFADCNIKEITIPNRVTSIGAGAFQTCASLESVTLGRSVASLGSSVFAGCKALTEIALPEGVTYLPSSAFEGCTSLTNLTFAGELTGIGSRAFADCTALPAFPIPETVSSIGASAFQNCTSLTQVTIPESVTSIGQNAFSGCTGLTDVYFPGSLLQWDTYRTGAPESTVIHVTHIGSGTCGENVEWYLDNDGVLTLTGTGSTAGAVTGIPWRNYKNYIKELRIESGVASLPAQAFSGCTALTSVTYGPGLTGIDAYAFSGCTALTEITLPDHVATLGENAFADCTNITFLSLGSGIVNVPKNAFRNCTALKTVVASAALYNVYDNAFANCPAIADVYYLGTQENWDDIYFASGNDDLLGAALHLHAHSFTETVLAAPTCTEGGEHLLTCAECGLSYEEPVPALGHDYAAAVTEATCTEGGYTTYTCSRCGDSYTADETKPLDHDYGPWTQKTAPTCTQSGLEESKCSRCNTVQTREIAALGHEYVNHEAKDPTCGVPGWEAYVTCTRCDYSTFKEIPATGEHSFGDWQTSAEPTCTEDGVMTRSCAVCTLSETKPIPAPGHDLVHHDAQAATCTEPGWDAYDTCSRCDYTTYEEIPAPGHDLVHHDAQAATCTEPGWDAYDTCSRCDYTTYAEKAALGHAWGSWTKLDNKQHQRTCANDPSHVEKENHAWNKGEITKPATVDEAGEKTFTCTVCGGTKTEEIPKLPAPEVPEINSELAKEKNGGVYAVDGLKASELLALAGKGSSLTKDGAAAKADDPVASGMVLTKADGSKVTVIVIGDNDGDGKITTNDARNALRMSIGLDRPDEWQIKASMIQSTEAVTTADARLILRAAIGLEDSKKWL